MTFMVINSVPGSWPCLELSIFLFLLILISLWIWHDWPFHQPGHCSSESVSKPSKIRQLETCEAMVQSQGWPSLKLSLYPSLAIQRGLETHLHGGHMILLPVWTLPLTRPLLLRELSSPLMIWSLGSHSLLVSASSSGLLLEGIRVRRNPTAIY